MAEKYTKEQLWKLYQGLPEELKEAMWSDEGADSIWAACERNGVEAGNIGKITKYVGDVLIGILPVDDFQKTLEKEAGLKNSAAKNVAQEIYRHIFFPVREQLNELYKIEIAARLAKPAVKGVGERGAVSRPGVPGAAEVPTPAEAPSEPPVKKPKKSDVYREPIK